MDSDMRTLFQSYGFDLSVEQEKAFDIYFDMLVDWNKKMNLTGIEDEKGVYVKHFLDSLMLGRKLDVTNCSLLDVGSGAGFPGIPLKIVFPSLKLTIIDALKKRITFLEALTSALEIDAELIHGRIEEHGQKEAYDIVTARAVASLNMLGEFCIPFVKKGGHFIAYKSYRYKDELDTAKDALDLLGAKLSNLWDFTIDGHFRTLLVFEKNKETPRKYPRAFNKIKSKPL